MKFLNKSVLTLSVAVMIAAAGVSNAQTVVKSKSAATTKQSSSGVIPLDPAVRTGKLPNGFTYYIRKNIEPKNRVQLYLANKIGSIMENDDQRGLAHFMEHMGFNGTKNFPKNDLVNYLQKAGVRFGADLNAYTVLMKLYISFQFHQMIRKYLKMVYRLCVIGHRKQH